MYCCFFKKKTLNKLLVNRVVITKTRRSGPDRSPYALSSPGVGLDRRKSCPSAWVSTSFDGPNDRNWLVEKVRKGVFNLSAFHFLSSNLSTPGRTFAQFEGCRNWTGVSRSRGTQARVQSSNLGRFAATCFKKYGKGSRDLYSTYGYRAQIWTREIRN